jgi:CDGSH-type Zn-finger protein
MYGLWRCTGQDERADRLLPMALNNPQAASEGDPLAGPAPDAPIGPEALTLPAGTHLLCACGRSRHGWFCDGAHLGTGRIACELRLEQEKTVWLCRCGRSRRHPLCDGSHARERGGPGKRGPGGWLRGWLRGS